MDGRSNHVNGITTVHVSFLLTQRVTVSRQLALSVVAVIAITCTHAAKADDRFDSSVPQNDTALNDIFFLNDDIGWCVGNDTILRTEDGGRNWSTVRVAAQGQFESVFFVDAKHGWIVGAQAVPGFDLSRGIVLRTLDGGRTWHSIRVLIPGLRRVQFRDQQNGWAVGDSSPMYPTGLFHTTDGGATWSGVTSVQSMDVTDGQVSPGRTLLVVDGEIRVFANNEVTAARLPNATPYIRALGMLDRERGWAAGRNGAVITTIDGGNRWFVDQTLTSRPQAAEFDYESVFARSFGVWIAGNPGSYIWRRDAETGSWSVSRTGISAPLRRIFFTDAQRGWAVADFGWIIGTQDGGRTWRVLKSGHPGAAVVTFAQRPDHLSLDVLARYAGDQAYVGAAVVARYTGNQNGTDVAGPGIRTKSAARQAVCAVGGSHVGFVDLPPANQDSPESADPRHLEPLVKQIRLLRPNLIVLGCGDDHAPTKLAADLLQAIELAQNRYSFTHHLTAAGLETWEVSRMVQTTRPNPSTATLSSTENLIHLGQLVEDAVARSRAMLQLPARRKYQVGFVQLRAATRGRFKPSNLLDSLDAGGNSLPKRRNRDQPAGTWGTVQRMGQKSKIFDQLLSWSTGYDANAKQLNSEINQRMLGLNERTTAIWLFQLADEYVRQGETDLASWTLQKLSYEHPTHWTSTIGRGWLVDYFSSGEFGQMSRTRIANGSSVVGIEVDDSRVVAASAVESSSSSQPSVRASRDAHGTLSGTVVWSPAAPRNQQKDPRNSPEESALRNSPNAMAAQLESRRRHAAKNAANTQGQLDAHISMLDSVRFAEANMARAFDGIDAAKGALRSISMGEVTPNAQPLGFRR